MKKRKKSEEKDLVISRKDEQMTKKIQNKILTAIVFAVLAFGSLQFVTWISQMAFENTCIELQEQYIGTEVSEVIGTIENSVNFGKEIENYYGMDELLNQVCKISEGNLRAAVLDKKGEPLYLSFQKSEQNQNLLSQIYAESYQMEIAKVTSESITGEKITLGDQESLVFPIYKEQKELVGHFIVVYQQKALLESNNFSALEWMKWMIWGIVSVLLALFCFCKSDEEQKQWYIKYLPVIVIMFGMFVNILFMFQTYKDKYSDMVSRNAASAAVYIQGSVDDLLDKGLPVTRVNEVSDYLYQKVESNVAIESIAIVQSYYNTSELSPSESSSVLNLDLANGQAQLNVVVSQSYITEKILMMSLTFGAVFVICLMITYELTHLAEIISVRLNKEFNQETGAQMEAVGVQIKLLSFLAYTAIYTSMSYTAVIMRNWDASLFGLSKAVSASLPLTIELLCIMLCSVVVQKVFKDMNLNRLMLFAFAFLILGNAACITASSPYILLCLRAFCGIGFGFLKYWLNSIVSAGSKDSEAVGRNYAQLNAGLLGGITVGASLGSILSQSLGYQFNYFFTGILCALTLVFALFALPWKMLNTRKGRLVESTGGQSAKIMDVFKNKTALKSILLGDIPLNIGLMYVVAFLPVYMDNIGQPTIATSYAYLINGLAGVYLGVAMMGLLKKLSRKISCTITLLLGASGILILVLGSNVGIALLSAGIMGLFDGYGTPTITSFFTSLPHVQRADTASMLTVFNSVGSAVQIVCPMLYNMLIQPDGSTGYLLIFGICYVIVAILFFGLFQKKELLQ